MKSFACILSCVMLACVFTARAEEGEGADTRPIVCIDVEKIQNKTDTRKANFSALIDRLNHELVQCGVYRVVNMADLATVLKDTDKFAVVADDGGNQTKIQTPGFYIRMTITQYGTTAQKQTNALYGTAGAKEVSSVELILSLVDMKTAATVASKNIKRTAVASVSAAPGTAVSGNFREQSLQEACKYVCQDIVKELVRNTPFYVLDVDGHNIMIDAPVAIAPVGSMFDIFKIGRAIRNRRTGKVTRRETKICTIKIVSGNDDGSTGNPVLLYSKEPVKVDYIARPAAALPQQAVPASAAAPF